MMILAVRYSFLFWLTISESLLLRSMESDDQQIYRISACVARCLVDQQQQQFVLHEIKKQQQHHENHLPESDNHSQGLEDCYHFCRAQNSTSIHLKDVRKIQENLKLELVCRDDRSLTFRIDSVDMSMTSATTTTTTTHRPALPTPGSRAHQSIKGKTPDIYVIKIHVARGAQEYSVYLTDDKLFTIDALKHNTTHIISAVVVHANNSYSVIAKAQQYRTLRVGYTPGMVQDIQVKSFHVNDRMWNDMRLTAEITWKPSADMTCHYNIICFSPESEEYGLTPLEIRDPHQLYSYNLVNLTFSSVYKIGIRAKNPNNIAKESELFWKTFEAPSCHEWFNNNFNICAPLQPEELEVEQMFLGDHEFSLNISWKQPEFYPDFYTLRVFDLTEDDNPYIVNVSKLQTSYLIPRILLQGFMYEVHLTAYTPGGNSTVEVTDLNKMLLVVPDKHHVTKLVSAILAPIFCFAILIFTTFIICYRRAKLKRYQERCKYFEDLEKKAPIDPKATFDFPTKPHLTLALRPVSVMDDMTQLQMDLEEKMLCFNDAMEIDRNDVALYEVLGEGAFGVVRRGLYQDVKLGPREVAVKMLKTQPTADDVHAFRREIEVMKSVEPHPNIVGIIGHCTKRVYEMLLLTEYCSFGNLLNFLRVEWKYMQEINVNGSYSNPLCSRAELKLSRSKRQRQKQQPRIGDANRIKQKNITNNNNNNGNVVAAFNLDAAIIAKIKQKYHKLNNSSIGGGSNNNTNSIKRSVFYPPSRTETATKTTATRTINISQERITTTLPTATINTSTSKLNQAKQMTCIQETQETATLGDETTTTTSATANKSYGYPEICTNACKCQVDVLLVKDIDDLRHHPNNMQQNESLRGGTISIITSTSTAAITTPTSSSKSTLLANATTTKAITTPSPSITQHFLQVDRKPPISTIQIKNCDCNLLLAKNNEKNSRLRDGSVSIQNKSYYNFAKQKRKISIVAPPSKKKKNTLKSGVGVEVKIDQDNVDDDQKDSDDSSVAVATATAAAPAISADDRDDFIGSVKREPLTAADLLDIAKQVAIGMEFLAKNKVVHRDLAARNVLVAPDRTIKIADFGLSRDVYQENIYKKTGNGKLPIKWLALESMTHQVYTTQSDVWSYGILLYEIVTLGGSPYPAIPTNRLLHLLKSGYRMEKPKNCGQEFYNLMYSCWALNPAERPNFTQIIKKLEDLMNETTTSESQIECLSGPKGQKSPQEITSDDAYLKPL